MATPNNTDPFDLSTFDFTEGDDTVENVLERTGTTFPDVLSAIYLENDASVLTLGGDDTISGVAASLATPGAQGESAEVAGVEINLRATLDTGAGNDAIAGVATIIGLFDQGAAATGLGTIGGSDTDKGRILTGDGDDAIFGSALVTGATASSSSAAGINNLDIDTSGAAPGGGNGGGGEDGDGRVGNPGNGKPVGRAGENPNGRGEAFWGPFDPGTRGASDGNGKGHADDAAPGGGGSGGGGAPASDDDSVIGIANLSARRGVATGRGIDDSNVVTGRGADTVAGLAGVGSQFNEVSIDITAEDGLFSVALGGEVGPGGVGDDSARATGLSDASGTTIDTGDDADLVVGIGLAAGSDARGYGIAFGDDLDDDDIAESGDGATGIRTGGGDDIVVGIGVSAAAVDDDVSASASFDLNKWLSGEPGAALADAQIFAAGGPSVARGILESYIATGDGADTVIALGFFAGVGSGVGVKDSVLELGKGDDRLIALGTTDAIVNSIIRGEGGNDTFEFGGAGFGVVDGGDGGQDELILGVVDTGGNLVDAIDAAFDFAFDASNNAVTITETGATEGLEVSAVEVFTFQDADETLSLSYGQLEDLFGVA